MFWLQSERDRVSNTVISQKEVHPRKFAYPFMPVYAVMLSKKHQRSSTVQEEGLTNEGRHHCCYCISERMTRGIDV